MRYLSTLTVPVLILQLAVPPALAKPKPPTAAQLQAQLKKALQERDDLKDRLAATDSLQSDLVEAQKSRDLARQEAAASRKELEQMKSSLADNQGGTDAILADLAKARAEATECATALQAMKDAEASRKAKAGTAAGEGALVQITPDIIPAQPMNLYKVTPSRAKGAGKGVVVVNVLISENGDVLGARLLQGLRGEGAGVDQTNAACVEAAKLVVFDPARTADGKTRVKVWQGVGFMLD